MGKKKIDIYMDDELVAKIDEVANARGLSRSAVIEEAIRRYLGILEGVESDADIEKVDVVKNWKLRFPTTCEVCGKELKPGERVVREIIVLVDGRKINRFYHPECYEYTSDPALARLYRKKRELERVIKALKKEADELADAINEAEARKRVVDASDEVRKVAHSIENTINEAIGLLRRYIQMVEPDNQKLREVYDTIIKIRDTITDRLDAMARKLDELAVAMAKPQKRKRKEKIEEWR